MWKRGGRSSALDRAQALLSAKKNNKESSSETQPRASAVVASVNTRPGPQNAHTFLSDVSDLSSVSSAPGRAAVDSAVDSKSREGDSNKGVKPHSPLGVRGSRFLKKAPPPATNSSQSPVRKGQMHEAAGRSYSSVNAPPSKLGSQTAALNKLAEIESRIHSRKHVPKAASAPPPHQAFEQLPAQSSSDESLKGKRFLKSKTAAAVSHSEPAATREPQGPDVGVSSAGLETNLFGMVTGVSLESDEEDMRKLLGESLDSNSFLTPVRASSARAAEKNKSIQRVGATPSPAAVPPSPTPRSPASLPRRSSPFRFTGHAQTHFSPSALSPSPSPPRGAGSPQRSLSSMSGRSEVLSLAELFPVRPAAEDPFSEMSSVSSEDFKINVMMTLDDLVPANAGLTEETPGKEQLFRLKEEDQQTDEDVPDYHSDFESESRTVPDSIASQISEHLQDHIDQEEVMSEIRGEDSASDMSRRRTEDGYSNSLSDTSCSYSQPLSRDGDSTASRSHDSQTFSRQSRRRSSTRKALKEAAVQTDSLVNTWPTGTTYTDPSPTVAHNISAEMVEALSTFNPAAFALNELLKQQLAMMRRFIESSRQLHLNLVQSLEPPNYRYTTLEDTKEYIRKHRASKLTMAEDSEGARDV